MNIFHSANEFPANIKTVVTIGTFDGLHKGHRYLLNKLNEIAKKESAESVLLTFFPHPRNVLFPEGKSLKLLNTLEEKISELESLGLDHLIVHEFTKDFSRKSSVNFVRDILVNQLNMQNMVVGYDHHFGRNREGSFAELKQLSDLYSFSLDEIPPQKNQKITVSSTKIREALLAGDIEKANSFLGYNYMFSGKVIHGDKIGREIGYPTANLEVEESKLIPKCGVYTVRVDLDGKKHYGMLNIGCENSKIEVHVFNFSQQIYDSKIQLQIISRLRNHKTIDGLDELKRQLKRDENKAKSLLGLLE